MSHVVFASELEELAAELAAARALPPSPAIADPLDRVARTAQRLAAKARTLPATPPAVAESARGRPAGLDIASLSATLASIDGRLNRLEIQFDSDSRSTKSNSD